MTTGVRPRILALLSQPLVYQDGTAVVQLDLEQERSDLVSWLEEAAVDFDFEVGGLDQLQKSLVPSVTILHFSGHGNDDGLLLEDQEGRAQFLRREDLAGILASYNEGSLKLAFLSACESEEPCKLVVEAGIPFVVGILRETAIRDEAARQFARAFYLGLTQGRSIRRTFEAAKAGVRAAFPNEADKFVLHHGVDADPEQIKFFGPTTEGQSLHLIAKAQSPVFGVPQTGAFFGRALDLASLISKLRDHRFVSVIGTGGIGKSSLAAAAARWFSRHRRFRDGILWIGLSDIQRIEILLSGIPALLDKDPLENIAQLARLMRDKDALLILDNFESALSSAEARQSARDFLNQLLKNTDRLRIIATTRELLGGLEQGETPVDVGRLDDRDALELLAHRAPRSDQVLAEVTRDSRTGALVLSDALRQLLDELHGYPLAITIVAPQLRDLTIAGLLGRIKEQGLAVFEDPTILDPVERTRMRSLVVSIGLSVKRLIDDRAESALQLFGILSLFPAGLPRQLLGELKLDRWAESLARLRSYSLIERDPEDDRYYLLAPVRRLAARYLDDEVRKIVVARAVPMFATLAAVLRSRWTVLGAGRTARLLAREEPNLREAINLCREVESPELGLLTPSLSIAADLIDLYLATNRLVSAERLGKVISLDQYWLKDPAGLARIKFVSGLVALRRNQLDQAEGHYQEAQRLYRTIDASLGLANTLKARGDLAVRRAQLDEAEEHYQEAEDLFRTIDDSLGLANTLRARGDLAVRRARLDEAEEHYQEAEDLFRTIDDSLGLANTLRARGDLAVRRARLDEAEEHYQEAEQLFRTIDASLGLANTLKARGDLAVRRGQLDEAEEHYQEAEQLFRTIDESLGLANTLKARGDLAVRRGQLDQAEEQYQEAEQLFRTIDDSLGLANTLKARGDLAVRRGQLDEAEEHYQEAEQLYRTIDASLGLANTLRARGDLAVRRARLDEAEEHYQEAEQLFRTIDASLGLANTLKARGDLAVRRGQLDEAEEHYQKAEQLFRTIDESLGLANTLKARGDLAVRRGQLDQAEEQYQEAEQLFRTIDDSLGLANTLKARGDLAVRRGQLDEAEEHYQEAEQLYRTIDASLGLANTLRARGDLAVRCAQLDEAEEHYQEAEQLYRTIDASLGLANTLRARGDLAVRCARLDEAEEHYQEAEQLYRTIDESLGLANTLQARGDLQKKEGHADQAMIHYAAAEKIYEPIDELLGLSNVLVEIAELKVDAGEESEALELLRRVIEIAAKCENGYAINKGLELLKKLGIDPQALK